MNRVKTPASTLAAREVAFLSGAGESLRRLSAIQLSTGDSATVDAFIPHSFASSASAGRLTLRQQTWRLAERFHSLAGASRIANHPHTPVSPINAWDIQAHTGRVRRREVKGLLLACGAWSPVDEVVRPCGEAECGCLASLGSTPCEPSAGQRAGVAADVRHLLENSGLLGMEGEVVLAATTSWSPGLVARHAQLRLHYWEPGRVGGWVESVANANWPLDDWFRATFLPEPMIQVTERALQRLGEASPVDYFLRLDDLFEQADVAFAARSALTGTLESLAKSAKLPGGWSFSTETRIFSR